MASARPSRIFLVDDHPLVREWLTALIHQQADLAVCGEAASVAEAAQGIARAQPEVAIVDLSLEDGSGLQLIKHVALRYPKIRVIVLSMHDEMTHAERALRAGARGYVMKRETAKNVVAAIRQVLTGKLYLSARMTAVFAEKFIGGAPPTDRSPIQSLSDRELEVFELLGRGLRAADIAGALALSAKTVHSYFARIKEKLRVASGAELLREAIRWNESRP